MRRLAGAWQSLFTVFLRCGAAGAVCLTAGSSSAFRLRARRISRLDSSHLATRQCSAATDHRRRIDDRCVSGTLCAGIAHRALRGGLHLSPGRSDQASAEPHTQDDEGK
jgi:hypothetical protein